MMQDMRQIPIACMRNEVVFQMAVHMAVQREAEQFLRSHVELHDMTKLPHCCGRRGYLIVFLFHLANGL